jgi:hypothetical protein
LSVHRAFTKQIDGTADIAEHHGSPFVVGVGNANTLRRDSMTNRFMMSVAAAVLIAGTGFANAQGMGGKEGGASGGGAAAQQSAPSGGSASERGSTSSTPMNRDSATEPKGAQKGAEKGADKGGMKATQSDEKMAPGAAKNERAQDEKAGQKGKSAQDNMSGDRSKSMSSDNDKAGSKDMKAEGRDGNRNAETKGGVDSKSQTTTGNAATSATAAPPAEKRTQIVSAIKSERIEETTNVNFNISVGTRVPTNVRFHPLPSRIVEIYPEWRGYDVIFVRGQYIIVRPQTHEIVYIIEG